MAIDISTEELNSLTTAIMTRHGIDFSCYEPKSLKRRIIRTLTVFKLDSIHELWIKILRDHDFIHPFVNELSVGLTTMFRDPSLWKELKLLIPSLLKEQNQKHLNIWHAGCSTGEEVFSLGIVFHELNLTDKVKAYATDMNSEALEQAQKGEYHFLKLTEFIRNYSLYNKN